MMMRQSNWWNFQSDDDNSYWTEENDLNYCDWRMLSWELQQMMMAVVVTVVVVVVAKSKEDFAVVTTTKKKKSRKKTPAFVVAVEEKEVLSTLGWYC